MGEFAKYKLFHNKGYSAAQTYIIAQRDGLDTVELIRMLRSVYKLSLVNAKELHIQIDYNERSLDTYQEKLASDLRKLELED